MHLDALLTFEYMEHPFLFILVFLREDNRWLLVRSLIHEHVIVAVVDLLIVYFRIDRQICVHFYTFLD